MSPKSNKPTQNTKPAPSKKPVDHTVAMDTATISRTTKPKPPAKRKSNVNIPLYAGIVAIIALVVGLVYVRTDDRGLPSETQKIPDSGPSLHMGSVDEPLPAPYNSNPPTSGWHVGNQTAPWGIQKTQLDDKITVHNLEHGGVIVHYKESLDVNSVAELEVLARDLQRNNPCLILMPRPDDQMPAPVVVTAWNHMLELQNVDSEKITGFFTALVGRGPEAVCRPM
ncbi:MAG: DUF3105 domain-containing protein [Chloroflexota bacterium]|jgi:hypothetical protein